MSNETTEEILVRLDCEGKLCLLEIAADTTAFRVQKSGHQHAHRFGCPDEPGRLGRFNDPCMQYGIWYGAQYPAGACYALWLMPEGAAVVKTLKMTNCAEFESRDEASDSVMDVEEMLTEILGYRVI